MSISRALGAEKPATKRPRSYMEVYGRMLPVAASPKKGGGARARARAPPLFPAPSARAGFFLYIYLYLHVPIPLYNIYIHLSLSLSLSLFLSRSSFWRGLRRAHVCATKLRI